MSPDYEPHLYSLIASAGCDPLPDVAVAVPPRLSVTVSVTASGCAAPSSVLPVPPHTSVNDTSGLDPVRSTVFTTS